MSMIIAFSVTAFGFSIVPKEVMKRKTIYCNINLVKVNCVWPTSTISLNDYLVSGYNVPGCSVGQEYRNELNKLPVLRELTLITVEDSR